MLYVMTRNAIYVVDRANTKWKRTSSLDPRHDDEHWIDGEFTVGDVGSPSFAHYSAHPEGALGRHTSSVVSVMEASK